MRDGWTIKAINKMAIYHIFELIMIEDCIYWAN